MLLVSFAPQRFRNSKKVKGCLLVLITPINNQEMIVCFSNPCVLIRFAKLWLLLLLQMIIFDWLSLFGIISNNTDKVRFPILGRPNLCPAILSKGTPHTERSTHVNCWYFVRLFALLHAAYWFIIYLIFFPFYKYAIIPIYNLSSTY